MSTIDAADRKLLSIAAGYVSFAGTVACSQAVQLALGIDTGSMTMGLRLMPNAFGAATVALGSFAALLASNRALGERGIGPLHQGVNTATVITSALMGGTLFVALGGRFWALSPSSLSSVGAFSRTARGSLPATLSYADASQRAIVQQFGRRFGCHTCGARFPVRFNADHIPPLSEVRTLNASPWRRLLNRPVKQRFYPQCVSCSSKQATLLAETARQPAGSSGRAVRAVLHVPSPLRPWYAVGGILAALDQHAPGGFVLIHEACRKWIHRGAAPRAVHQEGDGNR
jgi:hypothetical protein